MTVISRSDSTTSLPPGVHVKKVDFQSEESLTAALAGQDVLVCAIGTMATSEQIKLVDAAVAAKVKRFIPSEYGLNTRTVGPSTKLGKMLGTKIKTVEYLIAKTEQFGWFSWTALGNNLFFDWVSRGSKIPMRCCLFSLFLIATDIVHESKPAWH